MLPSRSSDCLLIGSFELRVHRVHIALRRLAAAERVARAVFVIPHRRREVPTILL